MTDEELIALAAENGYVDAQVKGDAGIVVINKFMFTWAILSGLTSYGYEGRWCYTSYEAAKAALDAWDGADGSEPRGWHRHPDSGRRHDDAGNQWINF
jgi:hypothetical protein